MADENKTVQQPVESKKFNVLLIAQKQKYFSTAASFLTRRGIPCTVRGNIKDGIQFITQQHQHQVTHVFLSWNLPNSNILRIHQLLTKTFKIECIVFAENPDGKTAAELANSKVPEILHAPVSGPSLYMRIQKLLKAKGDETKYIRHIEKIQREMAEQKNAEERQNLKKSKGTSDNDLYMRFSADKKNHEGPNSINFQSQTGNKNKGHEHVATNPEDKDINFYLEQIGYDASKEMSIEMDPTDTAVLEATLDPIESEEMEAKFSDTTSEERKIKRKKKEPNYGHVVNVAKPKVKKESDLPQYETTKAKEALLVDSDNGAANDALIIDFKPRVESKHTSSILETSVLEAIKQSTRPALQSYSEVQKVSKAKVMNIHTPRFKGYLIAMVPMEHELDRNVFNAIKNSIKSLLEKEGEVLLNFEELDVDIDEVDFLSLVKENAEFFIQTVDQNTEIICAYFPIEPTLPGVNESSSDMAAIRSEDLVPNTKTKCDLFLHMPKNNKYVRYLKQGDMVTEKHTSKFEKHELKNLHIKKEEILSFKEYFASNQIKDVIKKKKKDAA